MIMNRKNVDRRRHERFGIKQSKVDFKAAGLFSSLSKKASSSNLLVNMGSGGAQFTSQEFLNPGSKVRLSISIPAFLEKLTLTAKIVWCRKFHDARGYCAGVDFLKANKNTWQRIDTLRKDVFFRTQGQSKVLG